jgi:hypothetical protein
LSIFTPSLSICWNANLNAKYIRELLYAVWSLGHFLDDQTFQLTVRIFTWPGPDVNFTSLNNSQVFVYLRQKYPSVPILVTEYDRSVIPFITEANFPPEFPISVAGRLALPFFLDSDFILYLDTDVQILANPFPGLMKEQIQRPDALLMGVQDDAAKGDGSFMERIEKFKPNWSVYQQACFYFMRNNEELRAEMRAFFSVWSNQSVVLAFPEQDAVGIWFNPKVKGILPGKFMRQWADCYNKNDTVVRLMCHSRRGMEVMWEMRVQEMKQAGIRIDPSVPCCLPFDVAFPYCVGL